MLTTLPIALLCLAATQAPVPTPAPSAAPTPVTAPPSPVAASTPAAAGIPSAAPSATPQSSPNGAAPRSANAGADANGGWQELDRVVMIVNQDIIPKGRMLRAFNERQRRLPTRDPGEIQRLQTEIQTGFVKNSLAAQAGQDMGIDEKLVDRIISDRIDRMIADRGGVVSMSAFLESRDTTTQELRRGLREQLYGDVWEETVTGKGTGASTRASRDRFVRPGLRRFHFQNAIRHADSLTELGGRPEMWKLQVLVLDCSVFGGVEQTNAMALDVKKQIEDGANMDEFVQRYSPSDKDRGVIETPAQGVSDTAIANFAAKAPEDAVSAPLLIQTAKGTYVRLVRLLKRTPAVVPDLNSPECQNALVKNVQNDLDQYRLERAYRKLYEAAYIWPEDFNQRAKRP